MKLEDRVAQIVEIDEQIATLKTVRDQIRAEIVQDLKMMSADSFATDKATVTLSVQQRSKKIDLERLIEDYDLGDCYDLSLDKIKAREDIPLKEYTTYTTSEVLYVKAKKANTEGSNEVAEGIPSVTA